MLTIKKKIIFASATMFLALLLVAASEFTIRAIVPELRPPFVTEETFDQRMWLKVNRAFLKNYFPGEQVMVPELKPSLLKKQKEKNTFRILCLGESSMFGVPYQMTANIPGIIRKQLRHRYPEKDIEVVNLGASAINSNVILHLTDEFLALQPDLVLIYTGHNEFYGPDGIGASWIEKTFPAVTQWKYSLTNLALVHAAGRLTEGNNAPPSSEINLMKQVSQDRYVDLRSADAARVLSNFERNLTDIVRKFTGRNIPVVLSDVTSNISFEPFAYDSSFTGQFPAVRGLIGTGKYVEALAMLEQIEQVSAGNAYTHFLMGKAYFGKEQFPEAKKHFMLARDNDPLKFRAPEAVNQIIRRIARQERIPFFSADSIFAHQSRFGISDTTLFWEHLHPNAYGYYLIANGFMDVISDGRILPIPSRTTLPFHADSLNLCWLDLAFADMSIRSLTSKWPFRNFRVTTRYLSSASEELQRAVTGVYRQQKVWDEGCYETAQIFWKNQRLDEAERTYRAVLEEYPYNFYAHYLLANLLSLEGKTEEAIRHYTNSIASHPEYPYPKVELGLVRINRAEFDEAMTLLKEADVICERMQLNDLRSVLYYGMATVYANTNDFAKAKISLDVSLKLDPRNRDAAALQRKLAPYF